MNTGTGGAPESLFDRLYHTAKRIDVDGETYWRVEGDTLLDENQLRLYAQQREALRAATSAMRDAGIPLVATTALVGITESNKIVRWAPGMELSYSVLRQTFTIGGDAGYHLVVDSLRRATAD